MFKNIFTTNKRADSERDEERRCSQEVDTSCDEKEYPIFDIDGPTPEEELDALSEQLDREEVDMGKSRR